MATSTERRNNLNNVISYVKSSDISSIKKVVSGIITIINDPKSSVNDLKELIEIDPPLTARILKVANSAYYASRMEISAIQQAIVRIGYNALLELALSQKVCAIFEKDESIGKYSRRSLWKHSVSVSLMGKLIFRREFGEKGETIFVAGLLHDVGIIVEDQFFQDVFKQLQKGLVHEEINLIDAEYKLLGVTHTDIGKAIADNWNFPKELAFAIGCHHNPKEAPKEFSKIVSTLYIADYSCQEMGIGYEDAPLRDKTVFQECLNRLDIKPHALELITKDMEQELQKMEEGGMFL